jgi:hypothetical protein
VKRPRLTRGAVVCLIWAGLLASNAAALFAFAASSAYQDDYIYWFCGVGVMALATTAVLLVPIKVPAQTTPPGGGGQPRNGTVAPALALACLFGGLAWVFGVYLAWFGMPLVLFCLARWRVEWALRRRERKMA